MDQLWGLSGSNGSYVSAVNGIYGEMPRPKVSGFVPGEILHPTDYAAFKVRITAQSKYRSINNTTGVWSDFTYNPKHSNLSLAIQGQTNPPETPSRYWSTSVPFPTNRALNNLLDGGFDLTPALAESRETAQYLAYAVKDLTHVLSSVKRGRLGTATKKILTRFRTGRTWYGRDWDSKGSTVASRYLEMKYAIQPLAGDVASLWQLFQQGIRGDVFHVHGRAVEVSKTSPEYFVSSGIGSLGLEFKGTREEFAIVDIRARVTDIEARARAQLGVSDLSVDVLRGAWEVLPFSFMYDWAFGVSDYLRALTANTGLSFTDGYTAKRVSEAYEGRPSLPSTNWNGKTTTYEYGSGEWRVESYDRRVMSSFPIPQVTVKSPYSTGNLLSTLAIIKTLRG